MTAEEWLASPRAVVRRLIEHHGIEVDVRAAFKSVFSSPAALNAIPSLNAVAPEALPSGSLVRFRCMVQHPFDPELFLDHARLPDGSLALGRYGDEMDIPAGVTLPDRFLSDYSNNEAMQSRGQYYAIAVPGESPWATATYANQSTALLPLSSAFASSAAAPSNALKRSFDDDEDAVTPAASDDVITSQPQRPRVEGAQDAAMAVTQSTGVSISAMYHPLGDARAPSCILKVAAEVDEPAEATTANAIASDNVIRPLRLCQVVEVVGVYGLSQVRYPSNTQDEFARRMAGWEPINHVPDSIPRLHAIDVVTVENNGHPNLRVTAPLDDVLYIGAMQAQCAELRGALIGWFTSGLGGDALAAEYLLLHLLSRVHARHDTIAVGKMSLNLVHAPSTREGSSFADELTTTMSQLTTKCTSLPLALELLSSERFFPIQGPEDHRPSSGRLQLSDGTLVVVDETAMHSGVLTSYGVPNVRALQHVITEQTLPYQFAYQPMVNPTDLCVLVLSEGHSILTCDCVVPLDMTMPFNWTAPPHPRILEALRAYLAVARLLSHSVPAPLVTRLQDEFVAQRAQQAAANGGAIPTDDPTATTGQSFFFRLEVSRLVTVSFGATELTWEHWAHTNHLEARRLARIVALGPRRPPQQSQQQSQQSQPPPPPRHQEQPPPSHLPLR